MEIKQSVEIIIIIKSNGMSCPFQNRGLSYENNFEHAN